MFPIFSRAWYVSMVMLSKERQYLQCQQAMQSFWWTLCLNLHSGSIGSDWLMQRSDSSALSLSLLQVCNWKISFLNIYKYLWKCLNFRSSWTTQPRNCWSNAVKVKNGFTEYLGTTTSRQLKHIQWSFNNSSWSADPEHTSHRKVSAAGTCHWWPGERSHDTWGTCPSHITPVPYQSTAALAVWSQHQQWLGNRQSGQG